MSQTEAHSKNFTEDGRYLSVTLQSECYAIPLLQVKEVLAPTETRQVPFSSKHFVGIMNLRGNLIPIIDLKIKLNIQNKIESEEKAVVILELSNGSVGIIVDSVDCVETFTESELSEAPSATASNQAEYIKNVAKKKNNLVLILDIEKLLNPEINKLNKQAA